MVPQVEAAIMHQNLQRALSLTLGEVKQMIADRNDRVLKLEYQRRDAGTDDSRFPQT